MSDDKSLGTVIVQKLHREEGEDREPLEVDDLPTAFFNQGFTDTKEFIESEEGEEVLLRSFQHQQGDRPFENARYVQMLKEKYEEDGLDLYKWKEDEEGRSIRVVDRERILIQLYNRFGPGCYNVYLIGGKSNIEFFVRRTWIEEV